MIVIDHLHHSNEWKLPAVCIHRKRLAHGMLVVDE